MVKITSPDHPALDDLSGGLAALAEGLDRSEDWPAEGLSLCGQCGVYEWFQPREWGGQDWCDADIVQGYLRLAAACLTTTFILTQRSGACSRIAASDNEYVQRSFLPGLASGQLFATVGISHLTTSRRHLAKPVLAARESAGGFVLDGYSPWVTGARHAQVVVTGATLEDGKQILVALPMDAPGVEAAEPEPLIGLASSHTGKVHCRNVRLERKWLLAGPAENVMKQGVGAKTGGLQTSTLAIGLAESAIAFLEKESEQRADLLPPAVGLRQEQQAMAGELLQLAGGEEICTLESFRARANSLALRSAQAALAAAKGAGYVVGHPAGRWCREALFFLVWSCPQPVMAANLCELAGIDV
jgi:alkylation response protein AidB-like acyl-CoA dehydrogenase